MKNRYRKYCPKCGYSEPVGFGEHLMDVLAGMLISMGVAFIFILYSIIINPDILVNFCRTILSSEARHNYDYSDSMKALAMNITTGCSSNQYCIGLKIYEFVENNQTYSTLA